MDLTSSKSNSSICDAKNTLCLSAKIKRLQIEESLLIQSLSKSDIKDSQIESQNNATSYLTFSEFKSFSTKTKQKYREIKLKFEDIKTYTSSREVLKALDIDEVKSSTLDLENSIKNFKSYLQSELAGLKTIEQQLNQTLNENPVVISTLKRQPRIPTAKYNEIVPSPVKTIMNTPFKCLEVQQFQEFMMNSANRYGGWNEYHHNIFVNHWQKHFSSLLDSSFDGSDNAVLNSPALHLFLCELHPKLQGVTEEDIISHAKWYLKYLNLKERQQKAIDKWRSNRRIMKSAKVEPKGKKDFNIIRRKDNRTRSVYNHFATNNTDELNNIIQELIPQSPNQGQNSGLLRKCSSNVIQENNIMTENEEIIALNDCEDISGETIMHFQKPTMQWINKINNRHINVDLHQNNLENIKKLGTPTWRVNL